ncbi:MAG TPA: YicC family protein [Flavobacteriales bacterium]|nr:YicC family protein [Flavobacteriales bacterium]
MILSMTGYGNAEVVLSGKRAMVSVKSVNGKAADLSLRIPHQFKDKENDVRSLILSTLKRGKIDVNIFIESINEEPGQRINEGILMEYFNQMKGIASTMNDIDDARILSIVSKFPNVLTPEKKEADENEWAMIESGLEKALGEISAFRLREGQVLEKDLASRVNEILSLQKEVQSFEEERITAVRTKLEKQLEQLSLTEGPNRDRLEQELIYYLERLDITEENVRLEAHVQLFLDTLNDPESQGKKLGFIAPEIGREINTIGSKANHAGIQKLVVNMKDELEKIKEQLYNIL